MTFFLPNSFTIFIIVKFKISKCIQNFSKKLHSILDYLTIFRVRFSSQNWFIGLNIRKKKRFFFISRAQIRFCFGFGGKKKTRKKKLASHSPFCSWPINREKSYTVITFFTPNNSGICIRESIRSNSFLRSSLLPYFSLSLSSIWLRNFFRKKVRDSSEKLQKIIWKIIKILLSQSSEIQAVDWIPLL